MESYLSRYSITEIRELLLRDKSRLLSDIRITDTAFELHTKEIPAGVIRGTWIPLSETHDHQTEIRLTVDSTDTEKSASMLIYVSGYLFISIAFIIAVIKYPTSFWVYLLTFIACCLLSVIMRVYNFVESSPALSDMAKKEFLKTIKAVEANKGN